MKRVPWQFEGIYNNLTTELKKLSNSHPTEESRLLTTVTDSELSDGPFVTYSIDDLLSYVVERGKYNKNSLIATRNSQDGGYWIFAIQHSLLSDYQAELKKEKSYDRLHLFATILPVVTMFVYILNNQFNWLSSTVVTVLLLLMLVLQLIGLYYTIKRFKVFDPRVRLIRHLVKKHIF